VIADDAFIGATAAVRQRPGRAAMRPQLIAFADRLDPPPSVILEAERDRISLGAAAMASAMRPASGAIRCT
jgi:hypothetical protein